MSLKEEDGTTWSPETSLENLRKIRPGQETHLRDLVTSKDAKVNAFKDVVKRFKQFKVMDMVERRLLKMADEARTAVSVDKVMGDSSVLVAMRIRTFLPSDPTKDACLRNGGEPNTVIITDKQGNSHNFKIDAVLNDQITQASVYSMTAKRILVKVLQGYNGTVFAYGQTGSGKTFTMLGPDGATKAKTPQELHGIIPRVASDLFKTVKNNPGTIFHVKASYIEIYRENIQDLLVRKSSDKSLDISIRQQANGQVVLDGAKTVKVDSRESVLALITHGNRRRHVGGHALNAHSSRSHAIFTLYIEQATMKGSKGVKLTSKFNLIDLAGSERLKRTGATGERLKEGSAINQSLSALGNVIKALTDGVKIGKDGKRRKRRSGSSGHIPFRNSVLTRLLQDSLGGSAYTLMICNCAPGVSHFHETLSSLRFAERVKLVTNTVVINQQDLSPAQAKVLVSENETLRKQLEELQHKQSFIVRQRIEANNQQHEVELAEVRRHEKELKLEVQRAQNQALMLVKLTKATAQHDMAQIRSIVNDAAIQILGAQGGRLFLVDLDTDKIWSPLCDQNSDTTGDQDVVETRVELECNSIVTEVARNGDTAMVNNIMTHPKWSENYNPDIDTLGEIGSTTSLLAMPIKDSQDDKIMGVISVFNKQAKKEWTKDDRIALGVLCSHVSLEVKRRVHGIEWDGARPRRSSVASLLTSYHEQLLNVSTACNKLRELAKATESVVLDMLQEDCEYVSVHFIVDKGTETIPGERGKAYRDDAELWAPTSNIRTSKWTGLLGEVASQKKRIVNVWDADSTPHFERQSDRHPVSNTGSSRRLNQSMLIVPMVSNATGNTKTKVMGTVASTLDIEPTRSLSIILEETDDDEEEEVVREYTDSDTNPNETVLGLIRIGRVCNEDSKDKSVGFRLTCEAILQSVTSYIEAGIQICIDHNEKAKERNILLKEKQKATTQVAKAMSARRQSTYRHTTELKMAKQQVAEKIKSIEKVQEKRINAVKIELKDDFSKEKAKLTADYENQMQNLKDVHEKQLSRLKQELTDAREQLDDMFEQNENGVKSMKEEFLTTIKVYESDKVVLQERISAYEEEIRNMKAYHQEELNRTIQDMDQKHKLEFSKSVEKHEKKIQQIQYLHEKQLVSSQKVAESSGNMEMEKVMREHNRAISILKTEHRKHVNKIERDNKLLLDKADEDSKVRMDNLRAEIVQERNDLDARLSLAEKEWKQKLEEKNDELESYRERLNEEKAELMNAHAEEIDRLSKQVMKAQSDSKLEAEHLVSQVKAESTAKIAALMTEHREAMDEVKASLHARTEDANRSASTLGKEKISRRMSQFRHAAHVAKSDRYLKEMEELQSKLGSAETKIANLQNLVDNSKIEKMKVEKHYENELRKRTHELEEKINKDSERLLSEHSAVIEKLRKNHGMKLDKNRQELLIMQAKYEKMQHDTNVKTVELEDTLTVEKDTKRSEIAILENQIKGLKAKMSLLQESSEAEQNLMREHYNNLEEERDAQVNKLRILLGEVRLELDTAKQNNLSKSQCSQGLVRSIEEDRKKFFKWMNKMKTALDRNKHELNIRGAAADTRRQNLIATMHEFILKGPDQYHDESGLTFEVSSSSSIIHENDSRERRELKEKKEREAREHLESEKLKKIEREIEAEDQRLKAEAAQIKNDAARKRLSANITKLEIALNEHHSSLKNTTRICQEKNIELQKLQALIREQKQASITGSQMRIQVDEDNEEINGKSASVRNSDSLADLTVRKETLINEIKEAEAKRHLIKQKINNVQHGLDTFSSELTTIDHYMSSNHGSSPDSSSPDSKIQRELYTTQQEIEALMSLIMQQEQSMEVFMQQVAEMYVLIEKQISQYKDTIKNKDAKIEEERCRADDLLTQLHESRERCEWLEEMLKLPSSEDLRSSQSEIDLLRTRLLQSNKVEARLRQQSQNLRDELNSATDRVSLLERMMHIPALRKSSDLAVSKRQMHMTQRLSSAAVSPYLNGGSDPFDRPLMTSWMDTDASRNLSAASLPVAKEARNGFDAFETDQDLVYAESEGPLSIDRLDTNRPSTVSSSISRVFGNKSSPRFSKSPTTKQPPWAPTSPSASAQDAKLSAALEQSERRDLNSYTFLLQKKMGSPKSKRQQHKNSHSVTGYLPRVEVFTSTLHTVFMAFANRQTLTMGKTGFSRFGKECPGLIKSMSKPGVDESVIDVGHLQVIYTRSSPRNGKSRANELDFAGFVDALLWISIVKFPRADISLAFWRLITEHVFLFPFVPQQVQALAHSNASTKLAKLVLRQGTGRVDF